MISIDRALDLFHRWQLNQSQRRTMRGKAQILVSLAILTIAFTFAPVRSAKGQALEELKLSEAYRKLELGQPSTPKNLRDKGVKSDGVLSNYESLWVSSTRARLLLQWVEARINNYRYEVFAAGHKTDHAVVETVFTNRQREQVAVTIQVPMPIYRTMAAHRTLASFNRFHPPALETVGSQKIELHGVQADYYRHKTGACSVVIPTEQLGVINLRVSTCTQSAVMFEVAKALNVARLNQKLTS
ncbi:MAG: hypothetical protein ACK5GN_01250 [Pseudomonadota bacterium]|jgi:hypothetical protein